MKWEILPRKGKKKERNDQWMNEISAAGQLKCKKEGNKTKQKIIIIIRTIWLHIIIILEYIDLDECNAMQMMQMNENVCWLV